jgi:hypothetical protein
VAGPRQFVLDLLLLASGGGAARQLLLQEYVCRIISGTGMFLEQVFVAYIAAVACVCPAGNLVSKSGLDLSQVSGFTVVAEKLNFFRYISHFR